MRSLPLGAPAAISCATRYCWVVLLLVSAAAALLVLCGDGCCWWVGAAVELFNCLPGLCNCIVTAN
jgi:hypothetical protein